MKSAGPTRRRQGRSAEWLLALLLALCPATRSSTVVAAEPEAEGGIGRDIFLHGELRAGQPVSATHRGGASVPGRDAACSTCHRRSGLGSVEGLVAVPPIAGAYLYAPHGKSLEALGIPYADTERIAHEPYTDASLARAVRDGVGPDGREFNPLMPRYQLDDRAMASLIAYLKDLPVQPAPGVDAKVLHFATIITPEADALQRKAMLAVMDQYFADKNFAVGRITAPALMSAHRTSFRVERTWQLHVWQLSGPVSGWKSQLRKYLATEPVYAVVSGLGGSHWEPIHGFCEEEHLPCLFPNVLAPPGSDEDFYDVYFNRGVSLEGRLIARSAR